MRYIITQTQLHSLIYKYLDDMFSQKDFRKELNPYVKDGGTWRVDMFSDDGKNLITYFWYGKGEYDDGTPHNGVGSLHIHHRITDMLKDTLSIRESKVLDIVADWVSETLGGDIDEIDVYPKKENPSY
jgi:hypothetical protein